MMVSACGGRSAPTATIPPEAASADSEIPTSAEDVLLTERLPNGSLNWTLRAAGVVDRDEVMEADSIFLRVHEQDTPVAAGSGGVNTYMAGGCTVVAASAAIRRSEGKLLVELLGGFTMNSTNGWEANGEKLRWDGTLMTTDSPLSVAHGASVVRGSGARIDPRRNTVEMDNVSGLVENLTL